MNKTNAMAYHIKSMLKITKIVLLIFFALILGINPVQAEQFNGVEFELIVRQKPELVDKYYEVIRDTVNVLDGGRLNAFLVNFSLDLNVTGIDSVFVDFNSHLVTLGPNAYNTSSRFRIEYNLPARLENIPGKNGSIYQLLISPRKRTYIDTLLCPYNPTKAGDFKTDPTANFELSYIKYSLADFNWNVIRGYLEKEHVRFRNAFDLTSTGKIHYFLCPCPLTSVRWDKRFGFAINPGSSSIYALYSSGFVSCDAILTNMLRLYGLWGYAPPFLIEGLAGYFEFMPYKLRKPETRDSLLDLSSILRTSGFYSADPELAELMAASFMRFLADSYGISKVKQWYKKADDLTVIRELETVFEKPVDSLEIEWLIYIDTISTSRDILALHSAQAAVLNRNSEQIECLNEMRKLDRELKDSLETTYLLAMAGYHQGLFYGAIDGFNELIKHDMVNTTNYQILGNLHMSVGQYDSARTAFDKVIELDSTYTAARLMQARILAIQGDTAEALALAEKNFGLEQTIPVKIEYLLFIGQVKSCPGSFRDSATAEQYLADALYWSTDMVGKAPDDPSYRMRAGLAALELGDFTEAEGYLEFALFTEKRAIYLGRIIPALGKLYDLTGRRQLALNYYQDGLNSPIAVYYRDICKKYIDRPYTR